MNAPYDDDRSRLVDLAQLFQDQSQPRRQLAGDALAFVRLAYIARGVLDRALGAGNVHSARLAELCDSLEGRHGSAIAERYGAAAAVLRAAALERLLRVP
ncbi:hypothetical protein GT347_22790 [Xylophilus rhododendri]|uniref:Uncharacterized protein n=1 Tax=Xylophilus rhododendri TaxID=2697032 RepID=A0A857J991_9BURK|nr:hypothetical protein [Xylophilus rhododendri]QHJ00555.1 hypothetical protein GT347_22790 [Xylophilus rhododendri]